LNALDPDLTQERDKEAINLIEIMIKNDPAKRPKADELLRHIFFWTNDKKLKLIQDLSDRLEFNN
jgi:serine/threonine protein kinase